MTYPIVVKRFTLTQQAAELIARKIADGAYKIGDRIDPADMLRDHNVSRTVFREATRILEGKGLISARPNVGTRVNPREAWNILDPDVARWFGPDNEGHVFRDDATDFLSMMNQFINMENNPFYKKAYAAAVAIRELSA